MRLRAGEGRRGTEAATDTLGRVLSSPGSGKLVVELQAIELQDSQAQANSLNCKAEVLDVLAHVWLSQRDQRTEYVRANEIASGLAHGGELVACTPTSPATIARRSG